jgi:nucleolar protein TMA23
MDDSSASATEASIPASGASTPATSASETEPSARAIKKADKKLKRKRQAGDAAAAVDKTQKIGGKDSKTGNAQDILSAKDQKAVARKIAKLSPKKKALYEERASAKKQTINEYILRRITKKSTKRANRYAKSATQNLFFTDVSGDATLPYHQTTVTPSRPILGVTQQSLEDAAPKTIPLGKPDFATKKKPARKPSQSH